MLPFSDNFSALPGGSLPAFLFVLYPWYFTTALVVLLIWRRLVPEVSATRLLLAAGFSLFTLALLIRGHSYEGLIGQEMGVPAWVFWPYVRARVYSFPRLFLVLLVLLIFVLVEQVKATQFNQWTYVLEGNRYLLWARPDGGFWERVFYMGGQPYPLAEFAFYGLTIAGTFSYLCAARTLFPRWNRPRPGLRIFFPMAYGIPTAVLLPLIGWFVARRGELPFHAMAAAMSLVFSWIMYWQNPSVRRFATTPLFVGMAVFAFFQTCLFEIQHSSILGHWIYLPANELASLAHWLDWRFPSFPVLGMRPRPWPLEEIVSYITLYNFVQCWIWWMGEKLAIRILR